MVSPAQRLRPGGVAEMDAVAGDGAAPAGAVVDDSQLGIGQGPRHDPRGGCRRRRQAAARPVLVHRDAIDAQIRLAHPHPHHHVMDAGAGDDRADAAGARQMPMPVRRQGDGDHRLEDRHRAVDAGALQVVLPHRVPVAQGLVGAGAALDEAHQLLAVGGAKHREGAFARGGGIEVEDQADGAGGVGHGARILCPRWRSAP
jgi:hypothetical protein